jgi:tripeptidyl-peptidase-1
LKTKYSLYRYDVGQPHVACSEHHVPEHVKRHVEFITSTVHFDAKLAKRGSPSSAGTVVTPGAAKSVGDPGKGVVTPKKGASVNIFGLGSDLSTCN